MKKKMYDNIPCIMTRQQLQDILSISKSTALELLSTGEISSFRLKGRYRIPREALLEFIEHSTLY